MTVGASTKPGGRVRSGERSKLAVINSRAAQHAVSLEDDEPWKEKLLYVEKRGRRELERNLANVATILEHDARTCGAIGYNEFTNKVNVLSPPPWDLARDAGTPDRAAAGSREWQDEDDVLAEEWLEQAWSLTTHPVTVRNAAIAVAHRHPFHPARAYFDSLKWDGVPRISTWLTTYCGAEPSTYAGAIGQCWLISSPARIYRPGAKVDHVIIFEGDQGILKSWTFAILAGEGWFTDDLSPLGSKDAALEIQGVLIVEFGELAAMTRAEVEHVKQWLVRRHDRFRAPYGRHVKSWPRQCIFAGTVNPGGNGYLRDETGNRRFWPVRVGRIDIDGLRRDRDQLWAEAVAAFKAGKSWWLEDEALVEAARDEQEQRVVVDAWEGIVATWIAGKPAVAVGDILRGALSISEDRWTQTDQNRVAKCLKRLGRERKQVRLGRGRIWVYVEPGDLNP